MWARLKHPWNVAFPPAHDWLTVMTVEYFPYALVFVPVQHAQGFHRPKKTLGLKILLGVDDLLKAFAEVFKQAFSGVGTT